MAITTKAAVLAALLGCTAAAGAGWAQTAPQPAAPTETPATAPEAPAADAAAAPAPDAAAAPAGEAAAPGAAAGADAAADGAAPAAPEAETPAPDAAPAATPDAAAPAGSDAAADATAPTDAAPAAAPADAAAPTGQAPAGPAASRDAAAVGQYYVDSTHGAWTVRCIRAPEGTDPCELYQLLKDANGNSVSEVSMIPLTGEAAAGATIVAPLETDLVTGLGLKVDAGNQAAYPFNFCAQVGCVARIGFTQAEVDAMKRGSAATVSLLPYGVEVERKVDLTLSLSGFTAGLDAVAAKMPAPEAKTD